MTGAWESWNLNLRRSSNNWSTYHTLETCCAFSQFASPRDILWNFFMIYCDFVLVLFFLGFKLLVSSQHCKVREYNYDLMFQNNLTCKRLTHFGLVVPDGDIDLSNICPVDGLLFDCTKPLPEPKLTYHQSCGDLPVSLVQGGTREMDD